MKANYKRQMKNLNKTYDTTIIKAFTLYRNDYFLKGLS